MRRKQQHRGLSVKKRGFNNGIPVLGSVVLILILADKATSGEVIGLARTTALVLDLEPLEVGLVLDDFNESHDSFGYGANGTKSYSFYAGDSAL